jgi:peptidyl-prolyl cis-trans isomerase B (cyclophilin B)
MKLRASVFGLCLIILASCHETTTVDNSPKKEVKKKASSKKKKANGPSLIEMAKEKKPEVLPKNPITDSNVVERLMAYGKENPETVVDIYTTKGKIRARLYTSTPLHRANFIMMSKKGFLNGSVFTRVAMNFIAQSGGTYDEDHAKIKKNIGRYTIPLEMSHKNIHKRGAIAAARRYKDNPDKRSDPYAFYFVEGTLYNEPTLARYEQENDYQFTPAQREYYLNKPGAGHLDGQHTVFGEVISGYAVIPKITSVETDSRDWPRKDIFIDSVVVIR